MLRPRALVLYASSDGNATFSYQIGWPRALARDPRFDARLVNVLEQGAIDRLSGLWTVGTGRFDVVLLLHSVFSNGLMLNGPLFETVRRLSAPKVYFIGNEYKLMPEKMAFADALGIALLVSQSSSPRVHQLYRDRLGCEVTGIPNTGVDLDRFHADTPPDTRPIDLGYRSDDSPPYLGHNERRRIADYFRQHADDFGLRVDVSLEPRDRFGETAWAAFLNRCRGQLGTEAGGDYFSLTDEYRLPVVAYLTDHPGATFDDIHGRFFAGIRDAMPLRIISGRNVEAAATKTVQLLFEGDYDGYFRPDEHYIPLKKDFSNAADAVAKFRDRAFCRTLTDNAYALAATQFTYDALVGRVREAVQPIIS